MTRVMAIDGGLAKCGLVVVDTDGMQHWIEHAAVFTSDGNALAANRLISDKRVARARELRGWIVDHLADFNPNVVALEEFGFLRGQHATACLAMSYMTIVCECDRARVPVVATPARVWREELSGLKGTLNRTSKRGLPPSERRRLEAIERKAKDARTREREKRAHTEAMRRVEGAEQMMSALFTRQDMRVHALDALGLFCWSVHTPTIKALAIQQRKYTVRDTLCSLVSSSKS